ncbi:MAG: tetratricopeptide repeat protein, partial [Planctomycetia bacterium]|nr:tetratricopeptide repeat protein [Planctomycetia bacterium]
PYGMGYAGAYAPNVYAGLNPVATNVVPRQITPAATTISQPSKDAAASARDFANQGETAFKAGDYNGAVYAWRHSVLDDAQNGVVTMMLGQALFATGKFDEAAGATQAAMRLLPKDKWGVVAGNFRELYGNVQDYTDQLRALEQAVKGKPDNPALRFLTGFHYAYLGYPQEALDQFNRGLKLEPRDEMAKQMRDEMQSKLPTPVVPHAAPPAQSGGL